VHVDETSSHPSFPNLHVVGDQSRLLLLGSFVSDVERSHICSVTQCICTLCSQRKVPATVTHPHDRPQVYQHPTSRRVKYAFCDIYQQCRIPNLVNISTIVSPKSVRSGFGRIGFPPGYKEVPNQSPYFVSLGRRAVVS